MQTVSEQASDVLAKLLAWEMGSDADPKVLLRQVPLADLSVILSNMEDGQLPVLSVSMRLVLLEHEYRTGNLGGDWEVERKGGDVFLAVPLKKPVKFLQFTHLTEKSDGL